VLAAVAGSPWRVLSPWRTLHAGLSRLEGQPVGLAAYPRWLGAWPAVVGFGLLAVVENLTVVPSLPRLTAALLGAYAAVMLAGGVAFGPAWFRNADPLEVLYDLFGRVAPLSVTRADEGGYDVALRAPWQGPTVPVADAGRAAFVVAAVYAVSFDGLVETAAFRDVAAALRPVAGPLASTALFAVGLIAFLAAFAAVVGATRATTRGAPARGDGGRPAGATVLAPTVLPIAVAYDVAHNADYVLVALGNLPTLVGLPGVDPLGWVPVAAFWGTQVVLIVAGHLVAVVAAHGVLRGRDARSPTATATGHLPLTAVMVGYTVLSLWIVSRPVVI
jgi:hypothetical protein